ncbi:hypothetical protein BUALT_Bualt06G0007100 [Buddleja alternifolia]|uniref:Disease resistance R13L4/SHOC-2-like LRR domain-containing protein n=1 Tax=Buddleja alternifolia TaxID=168488 RepID=A0AAV6XK17_9LAMI|nr:hypothetical protein BUALT_Bualt06G0007100 [Buddleja alternifolia]
MHDLVRDLCIRKAQEEKFLESGLFRHVNETPTYDQRRVSIHNPVLFSKLGYYDSTIRTIIRFPLCEKTLNCLKGFRLLRVLDVVDVKLISKKFPTEFLELFFLRYLAFSFMCETEFEIPASISRLRNLETLVICPYTNYYERIGIRVRLPLEIWRMKQLRHLVLLSLDTLPDPCPRYSALENLQTLVRVSNFKCTKEILQMIPNLKKLGIVYQRYGIEWCEYNLNNLVHLHQLEKLSIRVLDSLTNPLALWGNLAFPMKLRKLKLKGFVLCPQDMMVVGSLPHLEVLKLKCCSFEDCKWETKEEEFPRLKFLQIIETNLQLWVTETSHFPRLQRLMLCCRNLDEIPNDFGEIPTLELIEVNKWDKSLVESAKRIKKEQHSLGNDSLQVRIVNFFNTFRFPIEWVRKARETNKLNQRFMARYMPKRR